MEPESSTTLSLAANNSKRPQNFVSSSSETSSTSRARSLGRSRSRGRTSASELLARKQYLLESSGQLHELSWSVEQNQSSPDAETSSSSDTFALATESRRSQARRAASSRLSSSSTSAAAATATEFNGHNLDSSSAAINNDLQLKSVESKLESLSELLKSHQQQQQQQQQNDHHSTVPTATSAASTNNEVPQTPTSSKSIDDVYILLAKKEKDLQLAAELGKVLLEKNDELSKANERITEDYSHKLELLEQDKHKLKRKLDLLNGEYENRLIELQTDCNILKNQLDEQQQLARQTEKEQSKLINDLVQQNQRLTSELVEATKSEELLSSQLEQMNERFNSRRSNRQDHDAQLETLKEEIQIVNQRKQDLERRLKLANQDKSNLNAALDESGDKIVLLENLLNEKDVKLGELMDEVNELRDSSSWLSNELEAMISLNEKLATSSSSFGGQESGGGTKATNGGSNTPNEQQFASYERKRSQLVDRLKELRLKNRSRLKANELILINRRASSNDMQMIRHHQQQRDHRRRRVLLNGRGNRTTTNKGRTQGATSSSLFEEIESNGNGNSNSRPTNTGAASDSCEEEYDDDGSSSYAYDYDADDYGHNHKQQQFDEWKEEIAVEIYTLLRRFQLALQNRKEGLLVSSAAANSSQSRISTVTTTNISTTTTTASGGGHLYSPNSTADDSGISGDDIDKTSGEQVQQAKDPAQWKRLLTSLRSLIEEMPCSTCQLMIAERADYEQLQKLHTKLCDEMKRKDDELLALNVVKTEQETKLVALEEKCAILSDDLNNCDKPKEEIVKLAWKARDEAVERKNGAEISLAKTRIENMQIASQLMEVVQQKGELSQKLAQFEDDIHYITQDSVKAKFTWEEYAEKLRRSKTTQKPYSGATNSNPLTQLLNFSAISSSITTTAATTTPTSTSSLITTTPNVNGKSSSTDYSQSSGLIRNLTSNRFNLKFWQRGSSSSSSSSEKAAPATEKQGGGTNSTADN